MLRKSGTQYLWQGGFDAKHLPKGAGFRWDPDRRVWWTQFPENAAKLTQYADPDLRAELEAYLRSRAESIDASRASDADITIPSPKGLTYRPFQKAGIAYALKRKATLLGDEAGLGKTIQSIGIINCDEGIRKVLIVCPASLKLNWQNELRRWLTRDLSIGVATSQNLPEVDVIIVNYDILTKHNLKLPWDLLIADEAHALKNDKAQRTKALLGYDEKQNGSWIHTPGIADLAKRKLFLTGTPIVNRPIELWPMIHSLDPETFKSFWGYAKRYCGAYEGRYGWDLSGASNLEELQEKLRHSCMVRRLKKDVLADMPPKVRQVVELSVNGASEVIEKEKMAVQKHEQRLLELKTHVELAKAESEEAYRAAVNNLRNAARLAFEEIARERHEVALAKVPQVIEFLSDVLEEHPIVVFAHHHDVINAIMSAFPEKAVKLTGEESLEERQAAIDSFQVGKAQLFVGSIRAAGLGITLTASSHVVFAELDWTPGAVTQAEDRCHRIGQRNSVLVQHLVLSGSLDSTMAKTIVSKQEVIDRALDIEHPPVTPIREDLETLMWNTVGWKIKID